MKIFGSLTLLALAIIMAAAVGCRGTYYTAYEKFGVYKRDLLKKRVVAARGLERSSSQDGTTWTAWLSEFGRLLQV